jgi:catechol 2,3-dioxygenase-like lactoylglutathione lyase family enzyme
MRQAQAVPGSAVHGGWSAPRFHHVGVQTQNLDNSVRWYSEFLGCTRAWTLDRFSDLTRSRLPGIRSLTEMVLGDVRIHLFERPGKPQDPTTDSRNQFQHFCFVVDNPRELETMHRRWLDLFASGTFEFVRDDPPTDIVVDDDGVQSFYAYDVNGLEFEFTFVPSGRS